MSAIKVPFTKEQEFAITSCVQYVKRALSDPEYLKSKPYFRLAGFAGTGKTSCEIEIMDRLKEDERTLGAACAFTGKAVFVMRKKGMWDSETIHRTIYTITQNDDGTYTFTLKAKHEFLELGIKYFLCDEASMLEKSLLADMVSIGLPIIFVGDPGQLEPVGDDPKLMHGADFTLTEIHRQAKESPIVQFSIASRKLEMLNPPWQTGRKIEHNGSFVQLYRKTTQSGFGRELDYAKIVDQVIVPTNKERVILNNLIRHQKGRTEMVEPGDRLICLENNKEHGVFNGMVLTCTNVDYSEFDYGKVLISGTDDTGREYYRLPTMASVYGQVFDKNHPMPRYDRREFVPFDYANAITCHKAQGSEWDRVLVIETWFPSHVFNMARWTYTAITRAAKELYYGRKM